MLEAKIYLFDMQFWKKINRKKEKIGLHVLQRKKMNNLL